MLFVCTHIFIYMYSYVIRMSFVCTRMSSVCHSYVLVCHPYVTRMYPCVIRVSLVCHSYVTRMYLYVMRISLVCTCMSSVCHSYVVLPQEISYSQDSKVEKNKKVKRKCTRCLTKLMTENGKKSKLFFYWLSAYLRIMRAKLPCLQINWN